MITHLHALHGIFRVSYIGRPGQNTFEKHRVMCKVDLMQCEGQQITGTRVGGTRYTPHEKWIDSERFLRGQKCNFL